MSFWGIFLVRTFSHPKLLRASVVTLAWGKPRPHGHANDKINGMLYKLNLSNRGSKCWHMMVVEPIQPCTCMLKGIIYKN